MTTLYLGAETPIVTEAGSRSIGEISTGDLVLSQHGRWRPASIRPLGSLPLITSTIKHGNHWTSVASSKDYQWSSKNGEPVGKSRELLVAPTHPRSDYHSLSPEERFAWCFGYFDAASLPLSNGIRVDSRLLPVGDATIANRFKELGLDTFESPLRHETIVIIKNYKGDREFALRSRKSLQAFASGFLAAAPPESHNWKITCSSDEERCKFIRAYFPTVGVYVFETESGLKIGTPSYYGSEPFVLGSQSDENEGDAFRIEVDGDRGFATPWGFAMSDCSGS